MRTGSRPNEARGGATVEFAMAAMVFFVFLFGTLEVIRAMYLWNTMAQATRRAARSAAVTDFNDSASLAALRQRAIFRSDAGGLPFGASITDSYLRVDYLRSDATTPANPMPPCPAENIINCMADPDGASCIRFVRVRLCMPGTDCTPVPYESMLPLDAIFGSGGLFLPTFETITPAATLGYRPGAASSCS